MSDANWKNRIISTGAKPAKDFNFNPLNWRRHPDAQRTALAKVLSRIGWVTGVIENKTTGHLIDGHARIQEALKAGPDTPVPFTLVALTEDEERQMLMLLDPLASLADTDEDTLQRLMELASLDDGELLNVLGGFADVGVDVADLGEDFELPSGDREPFQQLTFTLSDAQADTLKAAIQKAKEAGPFGDTGNENVNGNALARIAESYALG